MEEESNRRTGINRVVDVIKAAWVHTFTIAITPTVKIGMMIGKLTRKLFDIIATKLRKNKNPKVDLAAEFESNLGRPTCGKATDPALQAGIDSKSAEVTPRRLRLYDRPDGTPVYNDDPEITALDKDIDAAGPFIRPSPAQPASRPSMLRAMVTEIWKKMGPPPLSEAQKNEYDRRIRAQQDKTFAGKVIAKREESKAQDGKSRP